MSNLNNLRYSKVLIPSWVRQSKSVQAEGRFFGLVGASNADPAGHKSLCDSLSLINETQFKHKLNTPTDS